MSAKKFDSAHERQAAWRAANQEKIKAAQKIWWENNKGRYPKSKKTVRQRKVIKIAPVIKAELDKEDIFYIENHIKAKVPFETIANRACCDISDVEKVAKKLRKAI